MLKYADVCINSAIETHSSHTQAGTCGTSLRLNAYEGLTHTGSERITSLLRERERGERREEREREREREREGGREGEREREREST